MFDMFNCSPVPPEASAHHSRLQSCQPQWGLAGLAPSQSTVGKHKVKQALQLKTGTWGNFRKTYQCIALHCNGQDFYGRCIGTNMKKKM